MPWGFSKPSGGSVAAGRAVRSGARGEQALPRKSKKRLPSSAQNEPRMHSRGGEVQDFFQVTCLSRADRTGDF